jgi:hypothetical protein
MWCGMDFCSLFDSALAASTTPAVFLPDRHGELRFAANWTRDAYGRVADSAPCHQWALCRDRSSGFVVLALVTGVGLLADHPRLDVILFDDLDEALAARTACGDPPIRGQPW